MHIARLCHNNMIIGGPTSGIPLILRTGGLKSFTAALLATPCALQGTATQFHLSKLDCAQFPAHGLARSITVQGKSLELWTPISHEMMSYSSGIPSLTMVEIIVKCCNI